MHISQGSEGWGAGGRSRGSAVRKGAPLILIKVGISLSRYLAQSVKLYEHDFLHHSHIPSNKVVHSLNIKRANIEI